MRGTQRGGGLPYPVPRRVDEGEELAGGWREGVVWRLGRSSPARVVETSNALLAFGGFFDSVVGLPRSHRQRPLSP